MNVNRTGPGGSKRSQQTPQILPNIDAHRAGADLAHQVDRAKRSGEEAPLARRNLNWNDPGSLPPAAREQLEARCRALGIDLEGQKDILGAIQAAEIRRATEAGMPITQADMDQAIARYIDAMNLRPARQTCLFGLNSVQDARIPLSPQLLEHLARAAITEAGVGEQALWGAIGVTPNNGEFVEQRPQTPVDLIASMVRHIVGGGSSSKLSVSPQLQEWLQAHLPHDVEIIHAIGGAGAYVAAAASLFPEVTSVLHSPHGIPEEVRARLGERVEISQLSGDHRDPGEATQTPARINFILEYQKNTEYRLFNQPTVELNGAKRPLRTEGQCRLIVGQGSPPVSFGSELSHEELAQLASKFDQIFYAGLHNNTKGNRKEALRHARFLAEQIRAIRSAGEEVYVHQQYTPSPKAENERVVYEEFHGLHHSTDMNTIEVPPFLYRLANGNPEIWPWPEDLSEADAQSPKVMLDGVVTLLRVLQLERAEQHGRYADMIAKTGMPSERTVSALLKARQVLLSKLATTTGELREPRDLQEEVIPIPDGPNLGRLYHFADAVAEKFGLTPEARKKVVRDWHYYDEVSDQTIYFAPVPEAYVQKSGWVSTGDLLAGILAIFDYLPPDAVHGSVETRPVRPPHQRPEDLGWKALN